MRRTLFPLALAISVLFAPAHDVHSQAPAAEYVPGEIIIEFEADASSASRADARGWVRAARRELLKRRRGGEGEVELARFTGGSIEQALQTLRSHPAVKHAEPNWIYHSTATSNDPQYTNASMWGMWGNTSTPVNQFGSQAAEAWAAGNVGSSSVAVGIIDEGVQITHPDLAANIWTNPVEAAGVAGVDDDGNGYIDDLHGWDFVNNDNTVYDSTADDHGTHVAGTIGAVGGNGTGVVGVNWQVTLVPAKFIGATSGTTANAIKALDYLTDLKSRHGLNIVATNNSWGGGGFSQALLNAIVRSAKANILFVAAAGNSNANNDVNPFYPASYDTTAAAGFDAVVAVASITNTGGKSSFSSYGLTRVDLGAPGSSILSTVPGSTYAVYNGTSMATPHVAGGAALYASLNPYASAKKIREVILAAAVATPTPSMNGRTVTGGRLNIGEFAGPAPAAPSAPVALIATAISSSRINLSWTDTSANEDAFRIERCLGMACTDFAEVGVIDQPAYIDNGLDATTLYRYRVRAFNRGGQSDYSNNAEATTLATPPPIAHAGPDQTVDEGESVTLDGSLSNDPGGETLVYAWEQVGGPAVNLSGADTVAPSFTAPSVGATGAVLTFTLTVTAGELSAGDTVNVNVANVNIPPIISSAPPASATEDVEYVYAPAVDDEDGPEQHWRLLDSHSCGGSIDTTSGLFAFTPEGPTPAASCDVAIEVCDGNACDAQTATVAVTGVNDPPVITSTAPGSGTEDVPYSYAATATDEDGPGLAWTLLAGHTCGGSIDDNTGAFSFTPAGPSPPPTCVVAVQVCDGGEPDACAAQHTTVVITAVNDPPVITTAAPATATEDVAYVYGPAVSDDDGPSSVWSLLPGHSCGGTLNGGVFSFTAAGPVPAASCVVALQVCDGGEPNACASEVTTVAIIAVNDLPAVVVPADLTAIATSASGVSVSFTATASDPEDGPLTPACTPSSGSVFPIGATSVSCSVGDSAGGGATAPFTVTVIDPAVPGEMQGGGFIRGEGARYHFTFLARERASGSERARLSVRIDEHGKKKGKKRDDRFESRSVDFMQFSDETALFSGVGEWNGHPGYRYEVFAQDGGEPGRHRDSIRVTIWGPGGAVVASFDGDLDGGNIQSSRVRH